MFPKHNLTFNYKRLFIPYGHGIGTYCMTTNRLSSGLVETSFELVVNNSKRKYFSQVFTVY